MPQHQASPVSDTTPSPISTKSSNRSSTSTSALSFTETLVTYNSSIAGCTSPCGDECTLDSYGSSNGNNESIFERAGLSKAMPIAATVPSECKRHERTAIVPVSDKKWVVPPMFTDYVYENEKTLSGWKACTHPEGQLYFVSKDRRTRFVTDEYLYDEGVLCELNKLADVMEKAISMANFDYDWTSTEIALEMRGYYSVYYIVVHEKRCIAWLEEQDLTWITEDIDGIETLAHLKHVMESEYFCHLEKFPHGQSLPECIFDELHGIILHGYVDTLTSFDSNAPYSPDVTCQLLGTVKHLRKLHKTGVADDYVVSVVSRLMIIHMIERYFHFHGVRGARLSRTQSVRGFDIKRSLLIRILSPILFCAPETHLVSLEKIWIDKTIKQVPWNSFLAKLERDWEQFILYATVLLSANVSFLAVPIVINNANDLTINITSANNTSGNPSFIANGNNEPLSIAAVVSQVSILTSLGSIIIGLLLIRQHRTKGKETATAAAEYLLHRSHSHRGIETLAITYSLPYALLMWAMICFVASVCASCFETPGIAQPAIFAVAFVSILSLILWTIITGWETQTQKTWRNLLPECLRVYFEGPKDGEEYPENDNLSHREPDNRRRMRFGVNRIMKFPRMHIPRGKLKPTGMFRRRNATRRRSTSIELPSPVVSRSPNVARDLGWTEMISRNSSKGSFHT